MAKAFALGSGATDDWSISLSRVDWILAGIDKRGAVDPSRKERDKPLRQLFLHLRGTLLVRAGRPGEAAEALRDPAALHPLESEFSNWVYLALAEHALGRADKARAAAAKARAARPALKDDKAWERAAAELLAVELDAALPPGGKRSGTGAERPDRGTPAPRGWPDLRSGRRSSVSVSGRFDVIAFCNHRFLHSFL
jgi:hypothetical protein